jgi:hypothetical protein
VGTIVAFPEENIGSNHDPVTVTLVKMKKDVIEFMRVSFKIDDPKKCRFRDFDLDRYTNALSAANKEGGWAWFASESM